MSWCFRATRSLLRRSAHGRLTVQRLTFSPAMRRQRLLAETAHGLCRFDQGGVLARYLRLNVIEIPVSSDP